MQHIETIKKTYIHMSSKTLKENVIKTDMDVACIIKVYHHKKMIIVKRLLVVRMQMVKRL